MVDDASFFFAFLGRFMGARRGRVFFVHPRMSTALYIVEQGADNGKPRSTKVDFLFLRGSFAYTCV